MESSNKKTKARKIQKPTQDQNQNQKQKQKQVKAKSQSKLKSLQKGKQNNLLFPVV